MDRIEYDNHENASPITGNGPFETFTIESKPYDIGTGKLDMQTFRNLRVLDFSTFFRNLFAPEYNAPTIELGTRPHQSNQDETTTGCCWFQ